MRFPSRRHALWLPALVAVVVYAGALWNGFAYDDVPIIAENELVRASGRLLDLLGAPYWQGDGILYRPLPMLTYWLDWRVGGGAPWVFHLENVLWHAAATALVAWLALRWLPAAGALLVGLLFALHPVHVEAVANVIGRADVMAAVGLLWIAAGGRRGTAGGAARGVLVAVSFLAMCAKEYAVVAPVIAWTAARADGDDHRPALRLAAASAAGVALALVLRAIVLGTVAQHPPHPAFASASPLDALLLALSTLPRAAVRMLLPFPPVPDYSPTLAEITSPRWTLVAGGIALVALGAWALWRHARRPSAATLAVIFAAATLAPVSNLALHTGVVLGERTLYAPSVGAVLLVGLAAHALWRRSRMATYALSAAWVGAAAALAVAAVPMWRSTEQVITAMVERAPTSYWGHYHLGRRLLDRGDLDGAAAEFARARALFPNDPNLALDAATVALRRQDRAAATRFASEAVALAPSNGRARALLAALERGAR
jgi:hypothetical protein